MAAHCVTPDARLPQSESCGFLDFASAWLVLSEPTQRAARVRVSWWRVGERCDDDSRRLGLLPTAASYNALLAHRLQSGHHVRAWPLLDEMLSGNVQPCAVTCSVLLRDSTLASLRLTRIVGLIDHM